jgi:lipooligosaccharide transport system ATP-binding protein
MDKIIVAAKHLKKRFGEIIAVDDISFEVFAGERFGILGPNGAGKTSTIRMIYGFSPMTAGQLEVFGLDISRNHRAIKKRIGVCQQENSLDPDLSVIENLQVFARYFNITGKAARQRIKELLKFMAIEHRQTSRAVYLSGVMMRRLVLARALLNQPDLLILDEPTTGLDPQSRHQVWERLEELKAKGITILLTTHYMEEASRLCDRLIIMDKGKILVEGKPLELIRRYTGHNIIEVINPDDALRRYIQSRQVRHELIGRRLTIYGQDNDLLYHEISDNYCHSDCSIRPATLEDVFLRLTGRELRE